jgi:hypothetical protein
MLVAAGLRLRIAPGAEESDGAPASGSGAIVMMGALGTGGLIGIGWTL